MIVMLMSFLVMLSLSYAKDVNQSDYVTVQAENIQLTADISVETKQKDMYKHLYEKEQLWSNVKEIILLVAVIAL